MFLAYFHIFQAIFQTFIDSSHRSSLSKRRKRIDHTVRHITIYASRMVKHTKINILDEFFNIVDKNINTFKHSGRFQKDFEEVLLYSIVSPSRKQYLVLKFRIRVKES